MPLAMKRIEEQCPRNEFHYFPVIDSTMTEAARLAALGRPAGTVVLADEQTAGVGRLGRHWISVAEAGIYCSVLQRIPVANRDLPVVTLALGLATAEAIQRTTGLACDLRWPNDVLINERKTAGILAQLHVRCVIAGIGINVNQDALPSDLRTPATSLKLELGAEIAREPLIVSLLHCIEQFSALLVEQGSGAVLKAFANASSYALHRRVIYETDQGPRTGMTLGLDENGFLKVRDDSGAFQTLYTGGVRPDTGRHL